MTPESAMKTPPMPCPQGSPAPDDPARTSRPLSVLLPSDW